MTPVKNSDAIYRTNIRSFWQHIIKDSKKRLEDGSEAFKKMGFIFTSVIFQPKPIGMNQLLGRASEEQINKQIER
ncbi:unnamed protein product [Clonostachys rosea f. rosea IK726]|uniref:Uncharacterized protein n=1 Tax=Clonostachys rosea f. rosea IK726 TaxID=1349383 RepID=A0ACA9UQ22_BIOOC|nr:unnamed protein product [Clonostachys rosea f. rosea IK726]